MSPDEAKALAMILQTEFSLSGRWAHLVNSPRSAIFASEYSKSSQPFHENNIFSTVSAAQDYLGIDDLGYYMDWYSL